MLESRFRNESSGDEMKDRIQIKSMLTCVKINPKHATAENDLRKQILCKRILELTQNSDMFMMCFHAIKSTEFFLKKTFHFNSINL